MTTKNKKTYLRPETELIAATFDRHLLDWSADKGEGPGTGTIEIEAKQFHDDDEDWDFTAHNLWE